MGRATSVASKTGKKNFANILDPKKYGKCWRKRKKKLRRTYNRNHVYLTATTNNFKFHANSKTITIWHFSCPSLWSLNQLLLRWYFSHCQKHTARTDFDVTSLQIHNHQPTWIITTTRPIKGTCLGLSLHIFIFLHNAYTLAYFTFHKIALRFACNFQQGSNFEAELPVDRSACMDIRTGQSRKCLMT